MSKTVFYLVIVMPSILALLFLHEVRLDRLEDFPKSTSKLIQDGNKCTIIIHDIDHEALNCNLDDVTILDWRG